MDRGVLTDRLGGLRERLFGGNGDDDSRLSLGLTVLTLLGLAVAGIAAVARFALDRMDSDTDETGGSRPDPTESDFEFDRDASTAGSTDPTADRGSSATETVLGGDDRTGDEGPRIAPLVGMAAQVGFRLFVETIGERAVADEETTTE